MSEGQVFVWNKTFEQSAQKFINATGKDLNVLMKEVMRVLVETLYHWTPPPTKGNRGSRGGRAGGKAVVKDDIYKVAEGREKGYLDFLYGAFGGTVEDVVLYKKGTGQTYRLSNVTVDPTGKDLQRRHFDRRRRRGGVPGRASQDGSDVTNKVLTKYSAVKRYVRDTQKRVGKLKDAWTPALNKVDSKLPPAWVKTAGSLSGKYGTPSGSFSQNVIPGKWKGKMIATARSAYMRDADGFVRRAHQYVEKTILGKRMEKWLENMIKKHGDKS